MFLDACLHMLAYTNGSLFALREDADRLRGLRLRRLRFTTKGMKADGVKIMRARRTPEGYAALLSLDLNKD